MHITAIAAFALIAAITGCTDKSADPTGEKNMTPRLYRIIMPVTDIDKARDFYAEVLDMPGERISSGRHYFDLGGTILAAYDPVADGDPVGDGWRHHENQYIYIAVDDLEGIYARAQKAGAVLLSEIDTMPWGERLFYARDPFGNPICFVDDTTLFTGGD